MKVEKEIRTINRGGFGIVHEVLCDDGSNYARKTFDPVNIKASEIDKFKRRFGREVKIQSKLPKDFFIPIVYYELNIEKPWFLMPIADSSYKEEIAKSKNELRIPEGLGDILNSLEHLHKMGYAHRDLKPGNILLHEDKWKLADMGLITSNDSLTTSFETSDGFWAGSETYMAPEQRTNFNTVTASADIYSFGALLHDIFGSGNRIPYQRQTADGKIGIIISKCTVQQEASQRFKNIKSLREALLSELSKEKSHSKYTQTISKGMKSKLLNSGPMVHKAWPDRTWPSRFVGFPRFAHPESSNRPQRVFFGVIYPVLYSIAQILKTWSGPYCGNMDILMISHFCVSMKKFSFLRYF